MNEQDKRLQPVTYGSVIYLSTESSLQSFMFSDGFMDNRVTFKAQQGIIGEAQGHHDFTFCLFMVLPFANSSCFQQQEKMIKEWRSTLLDNVDIQGGSKNLEDKKNIVAELKNKLESELQFNIGTLDKSKGSNICFGNSNFMLLHVNSLKYLCLFQDDNSNLLYFFNFINSLELNENSNKNSFFNFDPSLKLQRGRSDNFVYEDEIVYLSCTEKFSGKSPFLTVKHRISKDEEMIIGAIDEKENWKVNIYEEPLEDSTSQYMRIGSCVWILLSEKMEFLVAERDQDPFLELYEFQHLGRNKAQKLSKSGQESPLSRLELLHQKKRNLTEGFFEDPRKHLYDEVRMKVVLSEIQEQSDKVGETEELSSFGLWKIESLNPKRGGALRWGDTYLLKHLVTGLYLSVNDQQVTQLSLSTTKDLNTHFQFVPIDNLIQFQNKTQMKAFIQKDAFFMIKCVQSIKWVGFFDKSDNEQDEGIKSPVLYDYKKDVNTFRFKEAKFSCVWENYSLVSSFPVLFQTINNTMDSTKVGSDNVDKLQIFDNFYKKTIKIMEFFVDFLMNRILSNINLDQEIMYPSDVRQNKFQQQFLLGLLCWMLTLVFPSLDEFEKMQIPPSEESLQTLENPQKLKTIKNIMKKKFGFQNQINSSKQGQEHLLKKYNMSNLIYKVLQAACYQNKDNQEFVYKFIQKLSEHFGFGEFVSEAFQIMFKDNFKILHNIHREQFSTLDDQGKTTIENIFQIITSRLKLFEPYKKIEILQLLGAFTHFGKNSIYINQEKVFSSIVDNKNFLFGHLMKLICDKNTTIQIEFRELVDKEFISRQLEMAQFCENQDDVGLQYFMAQMQLYALLCQNRNYACVKNMQELLPRHVLLSYLQKKNLMLTDEFRSILCFMMLNLYVDKEPRAIINKPNFVRVFRPPQQEDIGIIEQLNPLNFFQQQFKSHNRVKAYQQDPDEKSFKYKQPSEKDDDLTTRFIEINLSDDITGAYEIRKWLLDYLEQRTELIKSGKLIKSDDSKLINKVYNQLTFEVIRTLNMMVKFGLFTSYATELMQKSQENSGNIEGSNEFISTDSDSNHLERLTQLLAYLLEFDMNYFSEISKQDFTRTYLRREKKKVFDVDFLKGGGSIVGGLFKKEEDPEQEVEKNKKKQDQKDEYETHQFMTRYQSLLKIIEKFTNKTFTNKEFEIQVNEDIQVLIKRKICVIFDTLLEWRNDYFMENAIQYYKKKFYNYYKKEGDIAKIQGNHKELKDLMPDLLLNPGQRLKKKLFTLKQYCETEEVRDFDVVLERPFIEVLIMSFYFSQNSDLQNSIANLIYKLYSQRQTLIKNIQKISLVDADSGSKSYAKLSKLMNKLKGLISYSQSWLQIIEQNYYDEKAEEILSVTLNKLEKMAKIFEQKDPKSHEAFIVKQKVFKHLAGHKLVLKFIEQGTTVIDSRIDYFREDKETTQFSYKNQFIKKVKKIFVLCHHILSTFAEDNLNNQNQLHKHYGLLLINAVNINIGQVEFIQDLFRNNLILCTLPPALYFNFTVRLIRDHGHYAQFLQIFLVFLEAAQERKDNQEIQRQILTTLFNEENIDAISPFHESPFQNILRLPQFYPEPPNDHRYLVTYIQCIYECVKVDVGINYVIKVNQKLKVQTLLDLLLRMSKNKVLFNIPQNQQLIANVCEILHIYFSKMDSAIDQFKEGAHLFIELLELQMDKLKSIEDLNSHDLNFLTLHVVGLVNTYFNHFLKDIGMIALKMLSNDEAVQKERKVFEFAGAVSENLGRLFSVMEGSGGFIHSSSQQISNMAKLANNFNLPIPESFIQLKNTLQRVQYDQTMKTEDNDLELIIQQQHKSKRSRKSILMSAHRKIKTVVDIIDLSNLLPKSIKKHHGPTEFTANWSAFVEMVENSQFVKDSIKEERLKFSEVILSVQDMFKGSDDVRQREILISTDDTIVKLFQYIQYWKARGANRNTIIFVLKSIRSLVKKDQSPQEKAQQQCHLDSLNATSITLKLYWKDKQSQDKYIYQLIKFIIQLLDGGNKTIQMSILTLFKTNQDSEAFFRKIFNVLTMEMKSIRKNTKQVYSKHALQLQKDQRKYTEKTLRVVQLLCEGHNTFLQNYLRQQTNSKISYDLISLMVKLVINYKISNQTYPSVLQCLETITEAIQGPCKENQMVIVTSKFLEWSIDLLREEEKLFDIKVEDKIRQTITQENEFKDSQTPLNFKEGDMSPRKIGSAQNLHKQPLLDSSIAMSPDVIQERAHNNQGKKVIAIHRGLLIRLKYRCSILLLSLLEMQENNEEIVNRLIRSIPCSILANELASVYRVYKLVYGEDYVKEAFNRHSKPIDYEQSTPLDELVIEYGFNLFILVNILMLQNKKQQETELQDIQQIIIEYQFVVEKVDDDLLNDLNKLGDLTSLGTSFLAKGFQALKKNLQMDENDQSSSELAREKERLQMQKDAFVFFSKNTAFIEVIRDGELIRLFFPLLPHCKNLPTETRKQFHDNLDHSSTIDKLTHLMKKADKMIDVLNHEEDLRRIFKTSKILEFIANHKSLWENLAFIANIVVNLTILVSYNQYTYTDGLTDPVDQTQLQDARLNQPRFLFNQDYDFTAQMIKAMGVITLALSSLVIFFFFLKRAPLLLKAMWIKFFDFQGGCLPKTILLFRTIVGSLIACCTDFEFVYYSFFMSCLVLGLLVHPFIFVFLLVDFLRIQTIKIVVQSIWISKGAISLTFIVFLLVEYYFTIISYVYLYDQYPVGPCDRIWECFLVTFDQTFKNGGSIGEYLVDTQRVTTDIKQFPVGQLPINYIRSIDQQDRYVYRVIYDDSFKFILKFIIINMVAGIIIDTFGALKDAMLETERNLTEYCFICGIEKEKLDKSTPYGYYSHIMKDHNMWNYVYYKAYLMDKPSTEFSGNESYIRKQLTEKNIEWFPVNRYLIHFNRSRAMGVTNEDEEDDNTEKIELITQINIELPDVESIANKAINKVKILFEKI